MNSQTTSGRLTGKVALITGGSSGIGFATAQQFLAEGARVFITGRREAELEKAVKALGPGVTGIKSDISKLSDLDALFARIKAAAGVLDILFANAGGGSLLPLGQITEEHYDSTFNINVRGTLFSVQKALPLMPKGSSVILAASTAASKGTPAFSVYSATKAAIRSFARSWAVDLKEKGLRVNAISPGVVPTPGYDTLGLTAEQVKGFIEMQAAAIPSGRVGTPEDVAKAVVFLASSDSSWINGAEFFIDGGMAQV